MSSDDTNTTNVGPVASVGAQLAEERRRQGKSILEVASGTNIMARTIEFIEHGRSDALPTAAYVKGYIQGYAKFLGIPVEPLIAEYNRELGLADAHQEIHLIDESPRPTSGDQIRSMPTIPKQTWLIAAGVLIAILVIAWIVSAQGNRSTTLLPVPAETTSTATDTAASTSTAQDKTTSTETSTGADSTTAGDTATDAAATGPFTLKVSVAANSASWLKVTVDGLTAYEGTLSGGESKTWTVTDAASMTIGKPDAVTVTRDGTDVPIDTSKGLGQIDLKASAK